MMSVGTPMPIRAIPQYGGPDRYIDPSKLTDKQRSNLRDELEKQHYYVQYLHMEDPMQFLVEAEIRRRLEAEQTKERVPGE